MKKLINGDEIEVSGVKYRVIDGELMKVDDRSPLEAKVDALEERIAELESRPQWSWTDGTTPGHPDLVPYQPYVPYVPPVPSWPYGDPWRDTATVPWPGYPTWTTYIGGGTQI